MIKMGGKFSWKFPFKRMIPSQCIEEMNDCLTPVLRPILSQLVRIVSATSSSLISVFFKTGGNSENLETRCSGTRTSHFTNPKILSSRLGWFVPPVSQYLQPPLLPVKAACIQHHEWLDLVPLSSPTCRGQHYHGMDDHAKSIYEICILCGELRNNHQLSGYLYESHHHFRMKNMNIFTLHHVFEPLYCLLWVSGGTTKGIFPF